MIILKKEDFGQSYFDGGKSNEQHNAGYKKYERRSSFFDLGGGRKLYSDDFLDEALQLCSYYEMANLKVLDIGCAKGFYVEDLRAMGVQAFGMDISNYAISKSTTEVSQYLIEGDALTDLTQFANDEFDYVISSKFLECIDPTMLPGLIQQMDRISKNQIHIVSDNPNPKFYHVQTLDAWKNNFKLTNALSIMTSNILKHGKEKLEEVSSPNLPIMELVSNEI